MTPQTAPKVVSLNYKLKDETGKIVEEDTLSYLEGVGQIIPGLESQLMGLKKGEKKSVAVKAVDAYGNYEKELVVQVPREQIPKKDVVVGDRFHADDGHGHTQTVVVTGVDEKHVTVDGNHPLAGQDLNFDVEITDVREATKEEMQHGHAHGPGGHHH